MQSILQQYRTDSVYFGSVPAWVAHAGLPTRVHVAHVERPPAKKGRGQHVCMGSLNMGNPASKPARFITHGNSVYEVRRNSVIENTSHGDVTMLWTTTWRCAVRSTIRTESDVMTVALLNHLLT